MPAALPEAFDPEAAAATVEAKRAKAVKTKPAPKPKPAARKAAKSPPTDRTLLDDELYRQASLLVAANALLDEIEARTDEITPGNLRLSVAEERLLHAALPWLDGTHAIAREVQRSRAARLLFESGCSREAVEKAEHELANVTTELEQAKADAASIGDESGELLVDHLKRAQAKLDELQRTVRDRQAELNESKKQYEGLVHHAPKPLLDAVRKSPDQSAVMNLENALKEQRRDIIGAEAAARRLERIATLPRGESARQYNDLDSLCPGAIFRSPNGRDQHVDPSACRARAEELRTAELPQLAQREETLTAELALARDAINEPLHRWAATGQLTVEMLLG